MEALASPFDLAVLGAVPQEVMGLRSLLESPEPCRFLGETFWTGTHKGLRLIIGATGLGKVNAAVSTAALLDRFSISQVWNVGSSGAYPDGPLAIGDVLITLDFICGDEGILMEKEVLSQRNMGFPILVRDNETYYDHFAWDLDPLLQRVRELIPEGDYWNENMELFHLHYGPSVTVSMVSGDSASASRRFHQYHAFAENMEGSAVAHACLRFNVPMIECRGMSNVAGNRDKKEWRMEPALAHSHAVLMKWIEVLADGRRKRG